MPSLTEAFAPLAEDYARYRPSYPRGVVYVLARECGLTPQWIVADVGSGTGALARLFLRNGNPVVGVEPNGPMRDAGERALAGCAHFRSLAGAAEALPLADGSVDLITVGQALHWFDQRAARSEFARVLRAGGWVAIAWNERLTDATPFLADYDRLMRTRAAPYAMKGRGGVTVAEVVGLFHPQPMLHASFPNQQRFDLPGLIGRARSSSYVPQPGQPGCEEMAEALAGLFGQHQQGGQVVFRYRTELCFGQLTAEAAHP